MPATVCQQCGTTKSEHGGPLCWPCKQSCQHASRSPHIVRKRNGTTEVKLRCDRCWDLQIGHRAADYDLTELPVHADHRGTSPACVRCDHPETELHHFAPVALFGADEADRWPTAWLCPRCHRYWHSVMRSGAARSAPPAGPDAADSRA